MEKLGTTRFLSNLVKMCQLQLYDDAFLKKADENKMIFGCENGVLDLELNTIRPGVPDDYLTFSCGIPFTEYALDAPELQDIDDFLEKISHGPSVFSVRTLSFSWRPPSGSRFFKICEV